MVRPHVDAPLAGFSPAQAFRSRFDRMDPLGEEMPARQRSVYCHPVCQFADEQSWIEVFDAGLEYQAGTKKVAASALPTGTLMRFASDAKAAGLWGKPVAP